MSSGEMYRPLPNYLTVRKIFDCFFPFIRRPPNPTYQELEQKLAVIGQEFLFAFELSNSHLHLVNRSGRDVWINSQDSSGHPTRVPPNGRFEIQQSRNWKRKNSDPEGGRGVRVKLLISIGIDFDPDLSLEEDLLNLLDEKRLTDFNLRLGDEELACHKNILIARSPVLAHCFESSTSTDDLEISGASFDRPPSLKELLHFLYSGRVSGDVKLLADYLGIDIDEQTRDKVPPLRSYPVTPGILFFEDDDRWAYPMYPSVTLAHSSTVQIDPSICGMVVDRMTWTIPNFEVWKAAQSQGHIERSPEFRTTFLGEEFVFSYELHRLESPYGPSIRLISHSDRHVMFYGDMTYGTFPEVAVFPPNGGHCIIPSRGTLEQNGDFVVIFMFTILLAREESQLQHDLRELSKNWKFADFKLKCGDEEFYLHKSILAARSPAFAQIFEKDPTADQHRIKDFLPDKVQLMLDYVYTGTLSGEADLDLLRLANNLSIQGLVKLCGRSLSKTLTTANVLDLLDLAYRQPGDALKYLKDSALDFCVDHIEELMRSDQWQQKMSSFSGRYDDLLSIFNARLIRSKSREHDDQWDFDIFS